MTELQCTLIDFSIDIHTIHVKSFDSYNYYVPDLKNYKNKFYEIS